MKSKPAVILPIAFATLILGTAFADTPKNVNEVKASAVVDPIQRFLDAERKKREEALKLIDPVERDYGSLGPELVQIIRDALTETDFWYKKAQDLEKAGSINKALELYEKIFDRLEFAPNPGVPSQPEVQVTGYIAKMSPKLISKYAESLTRLKLKKAANALKRRDFPNAELMIEELLAALPLDKDFPDPDNPDMTFIFGVEEIRPYRAQAENALNQVRKTQRKYEAMSPDREVRNTLAEKAGKMERVKKLILNGRTLYEAREFDLADQFFRDAIELDPGNDIAYNYLRIMQRRDLNLADQRRKQWFRDRVREVNRKWLPPVRQKDLPVPNPYYRSLIGR